MAGPCAHADFHALGFRSDRAADLQSAAGQLVQVAEASASLERVQQLPTLLAVQLLDAGVEVELEALAGADLGQIEGGGDAVG